MESSVRMHCVRLAPAALAVAVAFGLASCGGGDGDGGGGPDPTVQQGQQIFRFDTFGDETFFTDVLRLHEPVSQLVTPQLALQVGLKVDADALPDSVKQGIQAGTVRLDSPETTVALLKLDAVIGLKGEVQTVNGRDRLVRLGVTCAICHSTVDNSFTAGIGKRLDGWPNRDLDIGAVLALSPALTPAQRAVYLSWGKGMYDARFNIVNNNTPGNGDGLNKPTVIPPAYGLRGVNKTTFTGDGDNIAYWNRYVAVTQFGGHGTFSEPRLNLNVRNGNGDDLVSAKLPALQAYQLSLEPPAPPAGSFNPTAALRGQALFNGKAQCSTCHSGSTFTDANERLHPKTDSMAEPEVPSHADRSATKQYRTTPLRGIWQHPPYFHDGSAPSLDAVVAVYNAKRLLALTPQEMSDLVQYLKSL
jgi:mono/diheme cytochrome c family protein